MFPWLRLFRVAMNLVAEPRVPLLSTTRIRLRVWPNDLDFNLHVNNGRYLALADIGRMHWFARTGLLAVARQRRALPVVGDAIAKFRRDLRVLQTFEIHTKLIGWDEKWGFLEHRFLRAGRVIGAVAIRGVFRGPDGPISPSSLLETLSHAGPQPKLPEWAIRFDQSSELFSELLRNEEHAQGVRARAG
jgi:acyl-CoA thioesterase FadM